MCRLNVALDWKAHLGASIFGDKLRNYIVDDFRILLKEFLLIHWCDHVAEATTRQCGMLQKTGC